jgi:acyl carrier protein
LAKKRVIFAAILADEFGNKVSLNDVIENAEIDSLEYLEFIQRLETEFKITLADEDVTRANTFRDLQALVEKLRRC